MLQETWRRAAQMPLDRGLNETDAVPSRLRNLLPVHPGAFRLLGGAALHLSGLALCGSGSASTSNVRLFLTHVKGHFVVLPACSAKSHPERRNPLLSRRLWGLRQ
jgi:hypothetical protein